jgi:hypothetical protein
MSELAWSPFLSVTNRVNNLKGSGSYLTLASVQFLLEFYALARATILKPVSHLPAFSFLIIKYS